MRASSSFASRAEAVGDFDDLEAARPSSSSLPRCALEDLELLLEVGELLRVADCAVVELRLERADLGVEGLELSIELALVLAQALGLGFGVGASSRAVDELVGLDRGATRCRR